MEKTVAKEPWQITREEFVRNPPLPYRPLQVEQTKEGHEALFTRYNLHKRDILEALASGKPVPPEVLKDYPELAKNKGMSPHDKALAYQLYGAVGDNPESWDLQKLFTKVNAEHGSTDWMGQQTENALKSFVERNKLSEDNPELLYQQVKGIATQYKREMLNQPQADISPAKKSRKTMKRYEPMPFTTDEGDKPIKEQEEIDKLFAETFGEKNIYKPQTSPKAETMGETKYNIGDKVKYKGEEWEIGFVNNSISGGVGTYRLQRPKAGTEYQEHQQRVYPEELTLVTSQGGQAVSRRPHKAEKVGSTPAPATKSEIEQKAASYSKPQHPSKAEVSQYPGGDVFHALTRGLGTPSEMVASLTDEHLKKAHEYASPDMIMVGRKAKELRRALAREVEKRKLPNYRIPLNSIKAEMAFRSPQARALDISQQHHIVIEPTDSRVKRWMRDQGSADIRGIDTPRYRPPKLTTPSRRRPVAVSNKSPFISKKRGKMYFTKLGRAVGISRRPIRSRGRKR